jgi:hypothetical protein
MPSVTKAGERAGHADKAALLNDTPGPSNALSRCRRKDTTKKKATRILSAAPGAISPCMQRSFVDW